MNAAACNAFNTSAASPRTPGGWGTAPGRAAQQARRGRPPVVRSARNLREFMACGGMIPTGRALAEREGIAIDVAGHVIGSVLHDLRRG